MKFVAWVYWYKIILSPRKDNLCSRGVQSVHARFTLLPIIYVALLVHGFICFNRLLQCLDWVIQTKTFATMTKSWGPFHWNMYTNLPPQRRRGGGAGVVVEILDSHHCGPPGIATLFVSEFGCQSILDLAGFLRVRRFPPASKIGILPISLPRLIWFSSLRCSACGSNGFEYLSPQYRMKWSEVNQLAKVSSNTVPQIWYV